MSNPFLFLTPKQYNLIYSESSGIIITDKIKENIEFHKETVEAKIIEMKNKYELNLSNEMERYTLLESKYYDLKKQLHEAVKVIEFYASPWEHTNHIDGIMVRIAESYDEFECWHGRAREFLQKMKETK